MYFLVLQMGFNMQQLAKSKGTRERKVHGGGLVVDLSTKSKWKKGKKDFRDMS